MARDAYTSGALDVAITKQRTVIAEQIAGQGEVLVTDYRQLAFFLISNNQSKEAVEVLMPVIEARPENADLLAILGLVYTNLKQYDEAIIHLQRALDADAQSFMAADQLTRCYLGKGDTLQAKRSGELALAIKDELYGGEPPKPERRIPQDLPTLTGSKNIIAFSLWGSNERYMSGALRNCELARALYPNWQCRFYADDTVPERLLSVLGAQGADVRKMPKRLRPYDGLFWRFHVASDTKIDRFLIRDCDSVINVKERVAVDEWLTSGKHFHVMRDYYTHTDLVMAGMWGGVTGVIEDIEQMINEYLGNHIQSRIMDQSFLNECLWSIMKQSVLVHDSCFETEYSVDFPPYCALPKGRHIGQDEYTFVNSQQNLQQAR